MWKDISIKEILKNHQLVHKDVKETMCSYCGSSFKGERKLKYHMRSVHAKKAFKCDVCPKVFSTNTSLIRHNKYHLNFTSILILIELSNTTSRESKSYLFILSKFIRILIHFDLQKTLIHIPNPPAHRGKFTSQASTD